MCFALKLWFKNHSTYTVAYSAWEFEHCKWYTKTMLLIKRSYRRILFSWGTLAIFLIVTILGIKGVFEMYSKESLSRERRVAAQKEQSDFKARHNSLSQSVSFLETDEGVESELRKKYRVIKPGEEVVLVVDDIQRSSSTTTQTIRKAWYTRFFEYFK